MELELSKKEIKDAIKEYVENIYGKKFVFDHFKDYVEPYGAILLSRERGK